MTTKTSKISKLNIPSTKTLEFFATPSFKSVTVLSAIALLAFSTTSAYAMSGSSGGSSGGASASGSLSSGTSGGSSSSSSKSSATSSNSSSTNVNGTNVNRSPTSGTAGGNVNANRSSISGSNTNNTMNSSRSAATNSTGTSTESTSTPSAAQSQTPQSNSSSDATTSSTPSMTNGTKIRSPYGAINNNVSKGKVDSSRSASAANPTNGPSGGRVMGETTAETPNGIVSTDPVARAYIKDNARIEDTSPAAGSPTYGSDISGNVETAPSETMYQRLPTQQNSGTVGNKVNTTGGMTSNGTNP